jgi:simple sugar transport system substrate-binding protein
MKHTMKLMLTAVVLAATAGAALADGAKIAVLGGKTDDPFFAKVIKGIDDGALVAKAHGSTVNYLQLQTYDNIGGDAANLVRTAISQKATVIAVPDWVPGSEDEAGGGDKAKELGAINYLGNEEYTAGLAAGAYFGTHGSKNVICVNTVPGAQNLEDRCKGVADGAAKNGSKSTELPLPASAFGNPTAVAEAIKATLIKDKSIDGLATISAGDADSAATGIEQAGSNGQGEARLVRHERHGPRPHQGRHAAVRRRPAALAAGLPGGHVGRRSGQLRPEARFSADPDGPRHRRLRQHRRDAGRRQGRLQVSR